ncbi:hypothetical protein [Anaeromyxobacter oryzae]|uniref:Lipoprotein n=1 Tax=Anaeromyxobacter oryzae TaxID=2918170 RepID=A0ABN6MN36_9BACT|nr:hypothetical protein [Anaeromyxobacter oryzae]BDG02442.1 hypothetical protein AMOR_14380 [Anaeromyxobacter oryzae]
MRRARRVAAVLALAAATALAGCSALHPRQPVPATTEGEWGAARFAATRRFMLYDGLVHRATATATYLGPAEREARARRLAEWLDWTPEELDRRLAAERASAASEEQFLLSFYTADSKVNDLDAASSVWRVALHVDGAELLPVHVEGVEPDATVRGLFPFVGPFDVVYLVHFPKAPGGALAGRAFELRISSALGKIPLDFAEVDGVEHPAPAAPAP